MTVNLFNMCVTSSVAFYKKDKYDENDLLIVKHVTGTSLNPDKKNICYHAIVKDQDGNQLENKEFNSFETAKIFGLTVLAILENQRTMLSE